MNIRQLSVFVENTPGKLTQVTQLLAQERIDIRALSIADTTNFGILRVIVSDPTAAEKALQQAGFTVTLTDVLAVGLQDEPGGLARAVKLLSDVDIDVEYMYAFVSRSPKTAYVILRVQDLPKAAEVLTRNDVPLLKMEDLYDL